MNQEIAKLNLRKYKISKIIISILGLLAYVLCAVWGDGKLIISALVLSVLFIRYAPWFFYRKYISNPLSNELNAPLYYEIVRQGKIYVTSAIWQLQAEYFVGNHNNAIRICNQKLNDPKISKKYKYHYLMFLANVYFDIGDNETLVDICQKFNSELTKESKRKTRTIKKQFPRIEFYQNFVNENYDACYSFICKPQTLPINQIKNIFFKARIALSKNEKEDAEKYFKEVIQKAPNLNYADLSKHGLESIEKDVSYKDTFDKIDISDEFIIPTPPKSQRIGRIVRFTAGIIIVAIAVSYIGFSIFLKIHENQSAKQYEEQLAEYNKYNENVRILLEENHDGVEIVETFNLKYKEQIVETMFVSKTDTGIIIGSLFSYPDENKITYDIDYEMPYSDLNKTHSPLMYLGYYCTLPDYYIECYFYADEKDVPDNYYHLTTVQVNEKTLYIVIMPILTEPPFDI